MLAHALRRGRISKFEVEHSLCISCGTCVALAPQIFELNPENKVAIKDANGAPDEALTLAAESCPVQAIFLFDQDGRQIVPKV